MNTPHRFPHFRAALRQFGTARDIAQRLGMSERAVKYYLAGTSLPKADVLLRFPELTDAVRRDLDIPLPTPEAAV
jgi:hypothetical protein